MKQLIPFKKDIIFKTKISEITSISLEHSLELDDDMVSGDFIISGDYKMTEASLNREDFNYKLPFDIALDSRYDTSNLKIEIDDFYYEIINDDVLRVNIEVSLDGLEDKPFKEENNIAEEKEEELEVINFNDEDSDINDITATIDELKRELDEKNANIFNLEKMMEEKSEEHKETLEKLEELQRQEDEEREVVLENTSQNSSNTEFSNKIDIENEEESKVDAKEIKSLFSNMSDEETFSTYRVYIMREEDNIESIINKYNINKEILSKYNDLDNIKIPLDLEDLIESAKKNDKSIALKKENIMSFDYDILDYSYSYEDILDNISKISGGEVEITDIDEETGIINTTITMKINGKETSIEVEDGDSIFDENLVYQINKVLKENNSEKMFYCAVREYDDDLNLINIAYSNESDITKINKVLNKSNLDISNFKKDAKSTSI